MAPASTPLLGSCVDASAAAATRDGPEDLALSMSPPPTAFVLFAQLCPPPPSSARGPFKRGGVACPPSFDSMLSLSLLSSSRALTYYVVTITTSLDAPSPLSLCRHHYCRANACLIAPLSRQQLVVASSPLLLRQCLSCRAGLLSLRHHLSRCAATSLVVPHLRRLVVASPTILTCRRLSCRALPFKSFAQRPLHGHYNSSNATLLSSSSS
jgi:hypothetical protein